MNGLSLRSRSGRRLVFGAAAGLRHILAPDNSSIRFASNTDLTRQWIVALRATIDRDWTWDGLAPTGISVVRQGAGEVGRIEARPTINADALIHPDRSGTDLIFFDIVDPKPDAGEFPKEVTLNYTLTPQFLSLPTQSGPPVQASVFLPMTTPPSQVPRLASAGLALSPYKRAADYSSTEQRRRVLWLEFDCPPDNPRDLFFGRILAYAPDPLLVGTLEDPDEAAEPPLPVDPEPIRTIVPGQSDDRAGFTAMQQLIPSDSPVHFMMPPPPGLPDDAPELSGGRNTSRRSRPHKLERLGEPCLQELTQFGCRLELWDWIQFLQRRRESIGQAPDRARPELVVLWFKVQIVNRARKVFRRFQPALDERFVNDDLGGDIGGVASLPSLDLLSHGFELALHTIESDCDGVDQRKRLRVLSETGVNTPETMFPNSRAANIGFPTSRLLDRSDQ